MKTAAFFAVSELLLVLVLILVFSGWHGAAGFNVGWPMNQCSVTISGGAQGVRILLAVLALLLAVATFVGGLVISTKGHKSSAVVKA